MTSKRTDDDNGYAEKSFLMENLARQQYGYLGLESIRNEFGLTVSYWKDLEAIKNWKQQTDHFDRTAERARQLVQLIKSSNMRSGMGIYVQLRKNHLDFCLFSLAEATPPF